MSDAGGPPIRRRLDLPAFAPSGLLRNPHIQTIGATLAPRRRLWARRGCQLDAHSRPVILDCGDGVRLRGIHSTQPQARAGRGLAVLLHGWEGCHDSVYLRSLACALFADGHQVFRLDLRDHGDTFALNREPFHSARMGELYGALRAIQRLDAARPLRIAGFSLGGSFALRLALWGPEHGVTPALTLAVSPVLNPASTLAAIDTGPAVYRRYFLRRWRRSLAHKAAAWPGAFDFSDIDRLDRLTDITRRFAERYTEYADLNRYLAAYTLTPAMLMEAPSPIAVLTAQDDPVIPFADFADLRAAGAVQRFDAPAHGGHCGFLENARFECWTERLAPALFADA
jgi:Predicted hydrolase of the alpha/beta-hydrolase fold